MRLPAILLHDLGPDLPSLAQGWSRADSFVMSHAKEAATATRLSRLWRQKSPAFLIFKWFANSSPTVPLNADMARCPKKRRKTAAMNSLPVRFPCASWFLACHGCSRVRTDKAGLRAYQYLDDGWRWLSIRSDLLQMVPQRNDVCSVWQ